MIKTENTPFKLEILGTTYVKYDYVKENLNLSAKRLQLWREGKGQAKIHPLKYYRLTKTIYLYSLEDIIHLNNMTIKAKEIQNG